MKVNWIYVQWASQWTINLLKYHPSFMKSVTIDTENKKKIELPYPIAEENELFFTYAI